MKKIILSIIFSIILVVLSVWSFNPSSIFQRKFGFKLPKSSKIVKSDYHLSSDKALTMKISFQATDFEIVEESMRNYFKKFHSTDFSSYTLPLFSNVCSWWDMDSNDIIFAGRAAMAGNKFKTRIVYVFITRNNKGEYYLYVKH